MAEAKKTRKTSAVATDRAATTQYRVVCPGISYEGKDAVTGDVLNDLPPSSVGWLLEHNYIEEA